MSEPVEIHYQSRIAEADRQVNRAAKLINVYSFLRLGAILTGIICIYFSVKAEKIFLTELSFFLMAILFALLVRMQVKYFRFRDFNIALKAVNLNEISSIRGEKNMYSDGSEYTDDLHPYSSDLDIFGKKSLFELSNRCATVSGNGMLASWFKAPAMRDVIMQRHDLLSQISGKTEWKQHIQAHLLFANKKEDGLTSLFAYLNILSAPVNVLIRKYIRLAPWLFITAAVLSCFYYQFLIVLFVTGLVNVAIVLFFLPKINRTSGLMTKISRALYNYSAVFGLIEKETFSSELLNSRLKDLQQQNLQGISPQVKKLAKLISRLEVSSVPFIGAFLNISSAWHVRQFIPIENWKSDNKKIIPVAFQILAEIEALISLSSLQVNNPDWVFPEIVESETPVLEIRDAGHPLINRKRRITNNFSLEDKPHIDIITGSNMAGKSTFLRIIGINSVLAFSGASVCAKEMRSVITSVFTYMRIRDSVNEDISTFKAELNRLKFLFDYVSRNDKVYFLIDEMLRGTNSADKYQGSKAVIEKLISLKSMGIVATHDLEISKLQEDYPGYIRNYYFDIRITGEDMFFDYKLKNGKCTTLNATLLLKKIGIETSASGKTT